MLHVSAMQCCAKTLLVLGLVVPLGCGDFGRGYLDVPGEADVDPPADGDSELGTGGRCVVTPNPAFVAETYQVVGSQLGRNRSARVDISDAGGSQSIATTTDGSGGLSASVVSQTVGAGSVSVCVLVHRRYQIAATCQFEVAASQVCGNGNCEPGEDCASCAVDCGECPSGCSDGQAACGGSSCLSANSSSYAGAALASQAGSFEAEFDVTPQAEPVEAGVGLASGTQAGLVWTDLAAIVRFRAGVIDARDGSGYAVASMPYASGLTYRVREEVDVANHVYSIFVTPPGGSEQTLGSGYAFRTEQGSVTSLDQWGTISDTGSLNVCLVGVRPLAGSGGADTVPPTVAITSPLNGMGYDTPQTVTIMVTASDNVGVTKVELYDGATLEGTDTSAPYAFALAMTAVNNGSHPLTARAYDAAGNSTVSSAVTVTVTIGQPQATFWLIGDSTVASGSGWGDSLQPLLSAGATVMNRAQSGASSKSFYEASDCWSQGTDAVLPHIAAGDYVFIQFGHNDEKTDSRYTDPGVPPDYLGTFRDYLEKYIADVRAAGAIPVLITPVSRMVFSASGDLLRTHGVYPASVKQAGSANAVVVLDLEEKSYEVFQALGQAQTLELYSFNDNSDFTHFPPEKAWRVAEMVAELFTASASLPPVGVAGGDCNDGIQNNGETDIDCGGATSGCAGCALDRACNTGTDCGGGLCMNGYCQPVVTGNTYYVATNGHDSLPDGDGSFSKPWGTWQKGFDAAGAGDIVYIRGGTYAPVGVLRSGNYSAVSVSGKHGTSANPIRIYAYRGEKPILDGANINQNGTHVGVSLSDCSYYHIKGLTIQYIEEYGQYIDCPLARPFAMQACTHMTIDQCTVHHSGDGFSAGGNCDYLTFLNCDSHDNYSYTDDGNFANGFTLTMYNAGAAATSHTTLIGCRSWHNSDDGYDFYNSDGSYRGGFVTMDRCWAFDNGWGPSGNGSGFKFGETNGTKESGVQRTITNCLAFGNSTEGFDQAGVIVDQVLYNNTAYDNGVWGFSYAATGGTASCTLRNNIAYKHDLDARTLSGYVDDHNSWNGGVTVTDADFVSLDSTGTDGPRQADGSLPVLNFLRLAAGSDLIDAGVDVGLATDAAGNTYASRPSMGAYEYRP